MQIPRIQSLCSERIPHTDDINDLSLWRGIPFEGMIFSGAGALAGICRLALSVKLEGRRNHEIQDEKRSENEQDGRIALRAFAQQRDERRADDTRNAPGREHAAVDGREFTRAE